MQRTAHNVNLLGPILILFLFDLIILPYLSLLVDYALMNRSPYGQSR